jgi:hypothetical protein
MANMKKHLNFFRLSPYTIAKNCTDLTDCSNGIDELEDWKESRERNNLSIPKSYYNRYANLRKKINKFQNLKKKKK